MRSPLKKRQENVFKKAEELSILCDIDVCVIHYGPNGELKTWPKEIEKVRDMALRYKKATKRKNCLNLYEFLEEEKKKQKKSLKKVPTKKKKKNGFFFDHYSPKQLSQLAQSLEQSLFTLQERFRFVEAAQKQRENTRNLSLVDHESLNTTSLVHRSQSLNDPNSSLFSLDMYNHGDATLSQIPFSASLVNQLNTNYQNLRESFGFDHNNTNPQHYQDFSALLPPQETQLKNHHHSMMMMMMPQKEQQGYGYNHQNMMSMDPCLSNPNYGFSNPNYGLSNTQQDYSALLPLQATSSRLNHQEDLYYGFDQNMMSMMMSDVTTNSNVLEHSYGDLCSDFQKKKINPNYYNGDMVGSISNPSFFPNL